VSDATPSGTSGESRSGAGRSSILVGLGLGVVAAVVGGIAWIFAYRIGQILAALAAVAVGVGIGAAVRRGGRNGVLAGVVALVLTLAAGAVGSNFAQRHELIRGIARLQEDWAGLAVDAEGSTTADTSTGEPLQDDPSCISHSVPPKEILQVLPAAALLCMSAEDLATVWTDVSDEKRAELPESARRQVEAVLRGTPDEQLAASRTAYDQAGYDIPDAVVACAPPPDFTQPTASAGLGFPDGVPLFLPSADLFDADRPRGDGLEFDPPTARCFARENAKEHPLEPISWLVAALAAFAIPFRRSEWRRS
jgi:hypothetical protein